MKQTDNRQKQQAHLRAKSGQSFSGAKKNEKERIPDGTSQDSEISEEKPKPFIAEPKIGRNEPCPCGSGAKYKKCCLGKPAK